MNEEVIPQTSPLASYQAKAAEIEAAVSRVMRSGHYLLGPETAAFEGEFASYIGVAEGVATSSGTDALRLALAACQIGPGDEVITVAHTAVATVAAIELVGARPVLIDIDPVSFTLDPAGLAAALSPRTRAVVPVHLYGHPADLDPIVTFCRRHGLRLIEDCAQAHGARYRGRPVGGFGDAAAFSFYPTKNLGAAGDGGMALTSDGKLASAMRSLRQYGWGAKRYISERPGWNARLDEVQAAILRVKLRGLTADNQRRRALAKLYNERLPNVRRPGEAAEVESVYHQYVIRDAARDDLAGWLRERGVQTLVHYPAPIHLQPAYAHFEMGAGSLPQTEAAAAEVLSLPMFPELTDAQVERVARAIRDWR